jgi:acyl-[acyl-carrier-protein]-phospholipid O-acyltransferase/long-chain-fatty-acid--[acyl-carrier-protein] ligase
MNSASQTRGFWGIVVAQFTGAFNDNAFRWFLIALAMHDLRDRASETMIITLAAGLFLLPYILVSMHAGSIADRYSKRKVLLWSKLAEAVLMLLGGAGFLLPAEHLFPYLCSLLFLLGTQSAYYSPAKFGALPELLPERRLSWGNGVLELTGFLAIITGSACGPILLDAFREDHPYLPLVVFSGVSIIGLVASWFVPRLLPAAPDRPIAINPLRDLLDHGGKLLRHPILFVNLLGIVYIWSLGVLFQLTIAAYAKENLGLDTKHVGYPMATVAIGVGAGSLLAGYLSGKTIEIGLVPLGAAGTAISSIALYLTQGSFSLSFAAIASLGFFAGFFIIPTHALLQEESEDEDKGGIWAATNFLQTLGMLLAAGFFYLLSGMLGLHPETIFLVTGATTLGAAAAIALFLPETVGRLLAWVLATIRGRVAVTGQENVPPHGPVLFLIEGSPAPEALLVLSGTRRLVRFLAPEGAFRGAHAAAVSLLRGIAIRAQPSPEEGVRAALGEAEAALARGQSVCVFTDPFPADRAPEVAAHRDGLAALVEKGAAPVVPVSVPEAGAAGGGRRAVVFAPLAGREVPPAEILPALDAAGPRDLPA